MTLMSESEIARIIVDVALKIHTTLGPGLLESVYESVFFYELTKRGLKVAWRSNLTRWILTLRLGVFA